ncbi:MAG: hemolysin family protein [Bacteroidetes bacterium]|nr:hemolysin family protein [Bacteroidota bacterium]
MEYPILFFLFLLNGLFAMFELAVVTSRKTHLEEKANSGSKGAAYVLDLQNNPEKFISSVQIGISIIGIITGAVSGLTIGKDLSPVLERIGFLPPTATAGSLFIIVGLITYFSLVFGEILPKTIALSNPEKIAVYLSPAIRSFSFITYPIIKVLSFSTHLISRIFNLTTSVKPPVTEEELKILIRQGSEHGVIDKKESDIIKEVFRFGDKTAYSLMTPSMDILFFDLRATQQEIIDAIFHTSFSRFPVCDKTIDNVIGIITIKDVLYAVNVKKSFDLMEMISTPLYIPETMPAIKVLELFREKKVHIGIVVNEFGATEGLITLHDISENILGDLPAMLDNTQPEVFRREDGSFLVDGSIKIEDLQDLLNSKILGSEFESENISTLGGLAMAILNRVPSVGDIFTIINYHFEIVDMDGNRVDKVMIRQIPEPKT